MRWLAAAIVLALPAGAAAETYDIDPTSDLVGRLEFHTVAANETLPSLAVRYGLGYIELRAANPAVDPWLPPVGQKVILPTRRILPGVAREGIVINLAELRLYYFPPGSGKVETYPLGIGREGWETPLGRTTIIEKRANPTWIVPASIRTEKPYLPAAIGPGPSNPLGSYALYLGWSSYLIHGTNKPHGVGRQVSHGCIRMYPDDIASLFARVPVATPVTVINQPIKTGWNDGTLFVEVHPTREGRDRLEAGEPMPPGDELVADALALLRPQIEGKPVTLNEGRAYQAAQARRGLPVRVSRAVR